MEAGWSDIKQYTFVPGSTHLACRVQGGELPRQKLVIIHNQPDCWLGGRRRLWWCRLALLLLLWFRWRGQRLPLTCLLLLLLLVSCS